MEQFQPAVFNDRKLNQNLEEISRVQVRNKDNSEKTKVVIKRSLKTVLLVFGFILLFSTLTLTVFRLAYTRRQSTDISYISNIPKTTSVPNTSISPKQKGEVPSPITVNNDFSKLTGNFATWTDSNSKDQAEIKKIYLINKDKPQTDGNKILIATVPDLYYRHYHNSEFYKGLLYVILRIGYDGYPDNDWSDQLWRYDASGSGKLLLLSKGIDFRTSSNNKLIALTHNNMGELIFINDEGQEVKKFTLNDLLLNSKESLSINPDQWTEDGLKFGGDVSFTAYPYNVFRVNSENWQVELYELPKDAYGFATNYDNLKTIYHTFPVFFEEGGYQDYIAGNPTVYLKLYNLVTKETQVIASTKAERFSFQWIDSQSFKYSTKSMKEKTFKLN